MSDTETSTQPGLLARVWRGQVSLPNTYWLWHVLFFYPVLFASFVFVRPAYVALLIPVSYWIYTAVGVWRSARRYRKLHPSRRFWGYLAQAMIILQPLGLLGKIAGNAPPN